MSCIYLYVYLVRVDLDINLLVVSDGAPHTLGPHVRQPRFPPRIVRHSSDPREKNRDFEPKEVDLNMGMGREWELPERNDSRKHSRKYSWELLQVQ